MAGEMAAQIGRKMRARRRELGLNQREVADRIPKPEIDNQRVSDWERGVNKPSEKNLELIAEALDQPVAWFYEPEEKLATPDLFAVQSDDDRLDQVLSELQALRAARDETAAQIQKLLREQSELLETIRRFVQEAPVEYAARVVARLSEEREAAAGREAPQPKPRAPRGRRPAGG